MHRYYTPLEALGLIEQSGRQPQSINIWIERYSEIQLRNLLCLLDKSVEVSLIFYYTSYPKDRVNIFRMIENGSMPKTLSLDLRRSIGINESIVELILAISSKNAPTNFHINLEDTGFNDESINILAFALKNGHCPEKLSLNLLGNSISLLSLKLLTSALKSDNSPSSLKIDVDKVTHNDSLELLEARLEFRKLLENYEARKTFLRLSSFEQGAHQQTSNIYNLTEALRREIYSFIFKKKDISGKNIINNSIFFGKKVKIITDKEEKNHKSLKRKLFS